MILNGKHTLPASPKVIWDLMMNPEVLARITPGITRLEPAGDDIFKTIAEIKVGPVGGAFTGTLKVADKKEPESFALVVQQNSRIGNAQAVMNMMLEPAEDGAATNISFQGDVKLSGMMATMGQRVLTPVASMLSGQFFEALKKELPG